MFQSFKSNGSQSENTPNIEVKFHHELIGIEGENSLVERAVIINNQTQETSTIDVQESSLPSVTNRIRIFL
jgi:thioredoxin reductase (NADPH)